MKVLVVLNRDGGTLKTTDLDWLSGLIGSEFAVQGHQVDTEICPGSAVVGAIEKAVKRSDLDVLIVGGGDGTVSAAAAACAGSGTALGILPAGTMNLFARTLQVPLDLEAAVAALAAGRLMRVDIATANGKPFVHQFAVGMHARMVRMRERISYGSRLGKVIATWKAAWMALRFLPSIRFEIEVDGEIREIKSPAVAFSNNFYGEGHVPYADDPTGGVLGVYVCKTRKFARVSKLTLQIMTGTWRDNPDLETFTAREVRLIYEGRHHKKRAVRDGELERLERETLIRIEPAALQVLVPSEATFLVGETPERTSA